MEFQVPSLPTLFQFLVITSMFLNFDTREPGMLVLLYLAYNFTEHNVTQFHLFNCR